jgi:malonyl-CoA O-methyltransferase
MAQDNESPPLDANAAHRWQALSQTQALERGAPWLHEEVGQRMRERLAWIKREPASWVNWRALPGGAAVHQQIMAQYPKSELFLAPVGIESAQSATKLVANESFLQKLQNKFKRRMASHPATQPVPDGAAQMVWANMCLHTEPDPAATVKEWHRMLAVDGYLMFSCLGPDTARELRDVYAACDFGPAAHPLTDMHDWGDLLVHSGFAEPVMDMERIVLTFASPQRALQELRGLGRNLHPARFAGLRTLRWREQLEAQLQSRADQSQTEQKGQIVLTFEIIYGHAFKPAPRVKLAAESAISMRDMRQMLAQSRKP